MNTIHLCLWIVTGLAAINTCLLYLINVNVSNIAAIARRNAD